MNNPCLTFSDEGKLAAFPGARREPRMNIIRAMLPRIPGVLAWLVVFVLGAIAVAGCSGEAAPGAQMPPPTVSVAPVLVKEVAHWDEFTRRVEDRKF